MKVEFSAGARIALRKSNKRALILEKIDALAARWPGSLANVTRLKGRHAYRLRVQDWRVIFRVEGERLLIDAIRPRGEAYEDRT